jgi:predicted DNA-binding transcriptional regulator YafY
MLGVDFEVHEPPELREEVRRLAARLGRAGELRRDGGRRLRS